MKIECDCGATVFSATPLIPDGAPGIHCAISSLEPPTEILGIRCPDCGYNLLVVETKKADDRGHDLVD